MARRGDGARQNVIDIITKAFGDDFVCVQDKKIYVTSRDTEGGEPIQFAISMTMPKVPVEAGNNSSGSAETSTVTAAPAELSDTDKAKVADLMRKLGIN